MNRVKIYDDFISDLILEQVNAGELPFKLTERLIKLLNKIEHKLSDKLIQDDLEDVSSKYTLVDYHDDNVNMFTFATSNKLLDYVKIQTLSPDQSVNLELFNKQIDDKKNKIWKVHRSDIRIGAFILKLYPTTVNAGKPGEDIESFVNAIKAERTKEIGNFKVVSGEEIVKYYYDGSYEEGGNNSALYNSCMSHKQCAPYIGFYPHNNVKLVILMSNNEKTIRGRAVLWDIDELDEEKVERKFLDRIYVIKSHDIEKFINLAKKNGWLYKKSQDMWDSTQIIDPTDNSARNRSMMIHGIKEYKAYPYMDTMKYFNIEQKYLTNDINMRYDIVLQTVDGGYEDGYESYVYDPDIDRLINSNEMIWSDEEERYLNPNTAVYSNYTDEWASQEYADEYWKYSDVQDDWIPNEDAVFIKSKNSWVHEKYANDNFQLCGYDEEWYDYDDGIPSEEWGIVPFEKLIIVITDDDDEIVDAYEEINTEKIGDYDISGGLDARYINDGTYFRIHNDNNNKDYYLDNKFKRTKFSKDIKKRG